MCFQVLVITLDQDLPDGSNSGHSDDLPPDNLFLNYLSRIHREEVFYFILKGVTRLLMNPLVHTYLPHSQRKVQFHQELLIFFWKFCEHNRKFLFFVLKSSDVLDILTPILHHLNDARADQVLIYSFIKFCGKIIYTKLYGKDTYKTKYFKIKFSRVVLV